MLYFSAKTPGNVEKWKALQEKDKHHAVESHELDDVQISEEPKADDSN